ncbi:MAG: helix-turn-helix transcriptional regulator [Treponema sp.]|jgi:putative molybdopterin biosynthesis protein|nr:helix-turn-helix transcriptional regulator [Treponema sp.]
MLPNLLTAGDVAEQLRIKKYTVYEIIKRGELPSSKVGKQLRVSQSDLDVYLETRKTGGAAKGGEGGPGARPEEARSAPAARAAARAGEGAVFPEGNHTPAIICGQDACLELLVAKLSGAGELVLRSYMGCYNALIALYNGRLSMAASHLWDRETGGYNYPFIRRLLPGLPVGVLRLAGRLQGFYVKKGNPHGISAWQDLARDDIVIINRERGCGTRILLDEQLRTLGIDPAKIRGYARESTSHLACAGIVAKGGADLGIGCERGMENVPGLEFVPLQKEWYDLVFPLADQDSVVARIVRSYVGGAEFRQDLEMMGGYDCSQTGRYEEF